MDEITTMGQKIVRRYPGFLEVKMLTLWEDRTVVITYFHNFYHPICREWAKNLSQISHILQTHGVRLLGIGLSDDGADEFLKGKFFTGELFLEQSEDENGNPGVDFKAMKWSQLLKQLRKKDTWMYLYKTLQKSLEQENSHGGTFIIEKGGRRLIAYHQMERMVDYPGNDRILNALAIQPDDDWSVPKAEFSAFSVQPDVDM